MAEPVVTAIIPTYRRPQLLRRAITSVLAQTYPHVRVFVTDNASGDDTERVVTELAARDPRVIYHRHATNRGGRANFQFGLDSVGSEYFSILSDDDFLLPHFYAAAIAAFERRPEARLYCAQTILYDATTGAHGLRPLRGWTDGFYAAGSAVPAMLEQHFAWTSCVFDASVRGALGPLDDLAALDVIYLVRAAALFPFVVELLPCALFTEGAASVSGTLSVEQIERSHEGIRSACAALPGLSGEDRARIAAIVDRNERLAVNGVFRAALAAGDRARLAETVAFLDARGALDGRKRVRAALAKSGGGALAVRSFARLHRALRKVRSAGFGHASAEDVAALYVARVRQRSSALRHHANSAGPPGTEPSPR